jgi:cell division septal protein FtsQ
MSPTKNSHKKRLNRKGNIHYDSKQYSNPFFQNKKRNRIITNSHISWKIKLIMATIILAIVAVLWFLLYSNFFIIENINADGKSNNFTPNDIQEMAQNQIDNNMFILWPQKNIFLFKKQTLQNKMESKYSFEKLEITKDLPDSLNIYYIEKKHSLIWKEDNKFYYANKSGIITAETSEEEIKDKDYPILENLSDKKINDRHVKVSEKYLSYTLDLYEQLKIHQNKKFIIDKFIVDNELNTIKLNLINNPQILFNTEEPAEKQINKLLIIKEEKLKDNFQTKSYIDVRIGDSVYYR